MTISEYLDQTAQLTRDASALLDAADPGERLDAVKGRLNALKDDRLDALQQALRTLAPEDRRAAGTAFNQLKQAIAAALDAFAARQRAHEAARGSQRLDLTLARSR